MEKTYTKQEVLNKYYALSNLKQVKILWDALDYMNQYNGRTRYECIELAMRAEYSLKNKED